MWGAGMARACLPLLLGAPQPGPPTLPLPLLMGEVGGKTAAGELLRREVTEVEEEGMLGLGPQVPTGPPTLPWCPAQQPPGLLGCFLFLGALCSLLPQGHCTCTSSHSLSLPSCDIPSLSSASMSFSREADLDYRMVYVCSPCHCRPRGSLTVSSHVLILIGVYLLT